MDDPIWLYLTVLRMLIPLVILKRPLLGLFACMAVDFFDFSTLPLQTPDDYNMYQIWDKILDTYYLVFAAYIAYTWKDKTVARLALLALAYRAIGVLLFIGYEERTILLLFPNLFESLFIFYLVFLKYRVVDFKGSIIEIWYSIIFHQIVRKMSNSLKLKIDIRRLGIYRCVFIAVLGI